MRDDWHIIRNSIDLVEIATRLLDPAPGRRGERGRRLWWHCPFHEDRNPSFCIRPGDASWHCFGCGEHGDAAALVMKLQGVSFPEAVSYLTGGPAPAGKAATPPQRPAAKLPANPHRPQPSGLSPEAALSLVEASADRLWRTPDGTKIISYLHTRGLTDDTIRKARLGFSFQLSSLKGKPGGVVIPWFASECLALVKFRQLRGLSPRYYEVYRDPARVLYYPAPETIRPGRPLIVTEGEFDALLLGQELSPLDVTVITLGSASARPTPAILGSMLAAAPWVVATDADPAGDKAAAAWPSIARRVRPPVPYNDWTDAHKGGINLREWWGGVLAGSDAYAVAEREAIQSENELPIKPFFDSTLIVCS